LTHKKATDMIVPTSFNQHQTYHGHLRRKEVLEFCDVMDIPKPESSYFQVFVSTGIDIEDEKLKLSMTALAYSDNACENILTEISPDIESRVESWFK